MSTGHTQSGRVTPTVNVLSDPFRKPTVAILGLMELVGLLSKDAEGSFGGITGLKPGKKRMLGEILLRLTLVFFQRNIENGGKVWNAR